MGLTIHYRGTLNDPDLIDQLCEELEDISKEMEWEYHFFDNDLTKPNTSYFDKNNVIRGHIPLKGILISVHSGSERLSFLFDKEGNLRDLLMMVWMSKEELEESYVSVKTQFAPAESHMTIVKLLRFIKKKYISDLEVMDEGEYWETNDARLLKEKLDFLDRAINEFGNMLSKIPFDEKDSPDSIINKIENLLQDKSDIEIKRITNNKKED